MERDTDTERRAVREALLLSRRVSDSPGVNLKSLSEAREMERKRLLKHKKEV